MSKKTSKPSDKAADDAPATESAAAAEESAEAAAGDGEKTLQQQFEELLREAEEHRENYLRAAAELENQRRRSEKKIAEAHQYALTDFALAVGEVRDCLETALDDTAAAGEKMREGVALTLRKLTAAMDARHIAPIKPDIGVVFDPTLHMAIGRLPATAQAAADTVAAVVQAGYMLNGRVIRAASVMVAADAAEEPAPAKSSKKPAKTDKAKKADAADDDAEDAADKTR